MPIIYIYVCVCVVGDDLTTKLFLRDIDYEIWESDKKKLKNELKKQ